MAASAITIYAANLNHLNAYDLLGATVKLALVSSAYTPDASSTGNKLWSSVSANEIANGNGYITGGATLATKVVTAITNGFKFSCDNVSWTASGGAIPAWRYGVFYVAGTLWGMTNPLIGYFLGDSSPADTPATSDGSPLTIQAPASGWFTSTKA